MLSFFMEVGVILMLMFPWMVSSQITSLTALDGEISTVVDNYFDKEAVIPLQTITDTMAVTIDMNLVSIHSFHDDTEKIEVSGYLTVTWTEERITRTADVLTSSFKAKSLWTPSLTLINCACTSTDAVIEAGSTMVNIDFNTGTIVWKPWFYGVVLCEPNMKYFPFDEHQCRLRLVPTDHSSSELLLTVASSTISQKLYNKNNQWKIESTSARNYVSNSKSFVEYELTIKREPQYIIILLLAPMLFISLLNVFVFIIPAGNNQRLGFCVINLLGIVVLVVLSLSYLPSSAVSVSIIVYYILTELLVNCILVGTVVCLEKKQIGDSKHVKGHRRGNTATHSIPPRSARKVDTIPCKKMSVLSIDENTMATGPPPSAWDDDDSDANGVDNGATNERLTTRATRPNKNTTLTDVDGMRSSARPSGSPLEFNVLFDLICFVVFLMFHFIFTAAFVIPLAFNV